MGIEIKIASPADAEIMSKIHNESWIYTYKGLLPSNYLDNISETKWVPTIRRGLENGTMHGWVAYLDDIPISCACVGKSVTVGYEGNLELISIYTLPDYLGMGIGKILMDKVKTYANEMGYVQISLWVLKDNYNAIGFYESAGFIKGEDTKVTKIGGEEVVELRYMYNNTNVCGI